MNENEIDIFLKEKAKSEQIKIPSEVGKSISYALNNLPKHRNLVKPAIAVAAFLIVSVVTLAMIPPAYAENIPILKSVFQFFGKSGDYTYNQYSKDATQVNQSVTDEGYTLTVNEVVADDNLIVVSYTAKGTKPFSKDFSDMPYVFGSLTQSGKLLTNGTGQGKQLDEFTFAGYVSYFVGKDIIPKKLDLNFIVDKIDTTHGKWNFSFTVPKQSTSKESKVVYPEVTASLPFANLKVSKVVLSRFANTLMLNLSDIKQPSYYHYFVLDDKGKSLYVIGNGQGSASEQNISFVKGKEDLNEITLIPYTFKPDYDLNPIKWLSKSTKVLPIVFRPSIESTVSVKKIESDKLITKVYYSIEGLYPDGYATKMVLIDDKGKVISPRGVSEILIDPDTNEFMTEFDSLDPNREYKVATPQLNDLIIINENKISVPLK